MRFLLFCETSPTYMLSMRKCKKKKSFFLKVSYGNTIVIGMNHHCVVQIQACKNENPWVYGFQ